jgi:hypothetical protein
VGRKERVEWRVCMRVVRVRGELVAVVEVSFWVVGFDVFCWSSISL